MRRIILLSLLFAVGHPSLLRLQKASGEITASKVDAARPWRSLFNGKDLTGWKVVEGNANSWQVADGILKTDGADGWLSTTEEFDDFDLELQFRPNSTAANSGVFLRTPQVRNPTSAGIEVQLIDDYADQFQDLKPYQYTGGLYGLVGPKTRVSKPMGQWQEIAIKCQGRRVRVSLNQQDVVEADLDNYRATAKEHPGVNRAQGLIGLQSHGGMFEFRKIRIRN